MEVLMLLLRKSLNVLLPLILLALLFGCNQAANFPGTDIISAPTDLSGTSENPTSIKLSWTDESESETGFKIERSNQSFSVGYSEIAEVTSNSTTYTDTGLEPETTYWYRVCALLDSAESEYTDVITVTTQSRQIIFFENFENDISEWYGYPDGDTFFSYYSAAFFHYTDEGANSTSSSMNLYVYETLSETSFTYCFLDDDVNEYQPTYISLYIKVGINTNPGGEFMMYGDSSSIWSYFDSDSYIYLYTSDGSEQVQSYSTNTWYKFEFKNIDWTNKTYDFYIDGSLKVSDAEFRNSSATYTDHIRCWNDYKLADFYWDEITIAE